LEQGCWAIRICQCQALPVRHASPLVERPLWTPGTVLTNAGASIRQTRRGLSSHRYGLADQVRWDDAEADTLPLRPTTSSVRP
jgi:hypothetical protein